MYNEQLSVAKSKVGRPEMLKIVDSPALMPNLNNHIYRLTSSETKTGPPGGQGSKCEKRKEETDVTIRTGNSHLHAKVGLCPARAPF